MKYGVSVEEATHVKVGGLIEKIASKWGVGQNEYGYATYAKPSEGGFGVTTESGRNVSMWNAQAYLKEE
jgi:hypothetical protein